MGMHIYFIEARERIPPPPDGFQMCGNASAFHLPPPNWQVLDTDDAGGGRSHSTAGSVAALAVLLVLSLLGNLASLYQYSGYAEKACRRVLALRVGGSSFSGGRESGARGDKEAGSGPDIELAPVPDAGVVL